MSITAAQLVAKVAVEGSEQTKKALLDIANATDQTQEKAQKTQGIFGGFLKSQIVLNALTTAYTFLKNQMEDTIKVAIQHQQAMAQTAAVLQSTHDASGMTAQSISDLADSLSQVTPFSEDVTESAENMLLTFTNIGKTVFPQATQTVLDMSQALGQDTTSSAIQLGKALNDPITGITALQRVGVTFTDSQKNLIKSLVDSGNVAGAQKVILQELQREFGGSADAAGKTFGGQLDILKNKLEDLKVKIGTAVMPVLSNLMGFVSNTILPGLESFGGWVQKVWSYFSSFDLTGINYQLRQLGGAIGNILSPLTSLGSNKQASAFFTSLKNDLSQALVKAIHDVALFIGGLATALNNLSKNKDVTGFLGSLETGFKSVSSIVGGTLSANFKTFSQTAQSLGKWWQTTMGPAIQSAMPGFEHLASVVATNVVPALAQIWSQGQKLMRDVMPPLTKAFETVAPIVVKVGGFLADNLGQALKFIMPFAVQAAQQLEQFGSAIITRVTPFVEKMYNSIKTFLDWIKPYWPSIWGTIKTVLTSTWDTIKGVVQIAWSIVSGIIKVGLDLLSGNWKGAWNDIKSMFSGIWDGIKSIAQGVWNLVKKPIMDGINMFKTDWSNDWSAIKTTFSNIWDGIKNAASSAWSGVTGAIKGGINDVINAINSFINMLDRIQIHIPSVGVGPVKTPAFNWNGLGIPDIPHLAIGGTIARGGMAFVGEQGPEPVWLPAGAQVFPHSQMQSAMAGYQGIAPGTPIILQMDGMIVARGLMPHIVGRIRNSTGVRF